MSFIKRSVTLGSRLGVLLAGLLASCSTGPLSTTETMDARPQTPAISAARNVETAVALGPPRAVRNWDEVRLQAAQRLMAANPGGTYSGPVVEPLLGIPVLEIELNGDGSVRKITVLRHPQEARDTSLLAEAAVRRAAPFGDVSRLPKPWRFVETFLFNDDRKFKPRSLDQ